jgi:hypothetical protein
MGGWEGELLFAVKPLSLFAQGTLVRKREMNMGKWHSMCQKIRRMTGNYILHFVLQKQGTNTELLEYL